MSRVCLVTKGEYSDYSIIKVFSSRKKAEAWAVSLPVLIEHHDMSRYNQAQEWIVDFAGMDEWHGRLGWYMTQADAERAAADAALRLSHFDFEEWEVE